MTNSFPDLFTPTWLGDLWLRNRIALAPMTRARAGASRVPNELMAEYYLQRAEAGLLITEATSISEEGLGWVNTPGMYTNEHEQGWKKIVESVHSVGATIVLQLWHCGRASHSSFHSDQSLPVAPSAIKLNGEYIHSPLGKVPYETPRALDEHEIPRVVRDYAHAACRARDVGFDGVEVHAANGYLIDQFLQPHSNRRTDRYGGGIENRCRLLLEVVAAICGEWACNRVGVRLSPNGNFNDMGCQEFRETFSYVASRLNEYGLAYLHVLDGLAFGCHKHGEPMRIGEFRELFHSGLIANSGYTAGAANAIIEAGDADVVAFGRPFISNPDLVQRLENGWPLAELADRSVWYSDTAKDGYTDFPKYESSAIKPT